MANSVTNFSVENIIIKLDNGNELKLDVTHISSIIHTLNNCVNNTTVKRINKIDIKQVEQDIINDDRWNINDLSLNSFGEFNNYADNSYNYLINNFIGIRYIDNSKNNYCMIIMVPTNNYELLDNVILFEINNPFDGKYKQNISDFMYCIKTICKKERPDNSYINILGEVVYVGGSPYDRYNIIDEGTKLFIDEYDTYIKIIFRFDIEEQ